MVFMPFSCIGVDVCPCLLQVPLFTLLHKYDGEEVTYQAIPGVVGLLQGCHTVQRKALLCGAVQCPKLPRIAVWCSAVLECKGGGGAGEM